MRLIVEDWAGKKSCLVKIFTVLLSFVLFVSIMTISIPRAAAEDEAAGEPPAAEDPAPEEEPPAAEDPAPEEEPPAAEDPGIAEVPEGEIVEVEGRECINRQVIVKFKNNATKGLVSNVLKSLSCEVETEITDEGLLLVEVPESETIESFIEALYENAFVEFVQPNYVYAIDQTVNDPYAATNQWYLDKLDAYEAWDITMGDPDIKVAVIDTGIDLDHPEFSGKIYAQADVVDYDGNAQDDHGHGTHVAGIIAATANNGIGIAGVAPGVKLIVVDVYGPTYASTADIVEGVEYAAEQGADVVNISLGGYSNDTALQAAMQDAAAGGIVVVASAGNDNISDIHYPSDYDPVISVMATDMNDVRVPISNYGPQKDISAPGILIYSTYINTAGYTSMTGTSMASPMVAAVAALVLSVNPDLSVSQVKDILYSTSVDLGAPGRDDYYGYGRVDALAAVTAAAESLPEQYTVSVEANNPEYGTVSGGGSYNSGTEATVTAQPQSGCSFVNWTKDGQPVSTSAQYSFTVTESLTLTAVFEQETSSAALASDVYTIDREKNMVKQVSVSTTVEQFKSKLSNAPEDIHIFYKDGTECFEGIISSGMTVALVIEGITEDELIISVLGDISGDGTIDITDILYIRAEITGTYALNDYESAAAEINSDGYIDITDILYIRAHVTGNYSITGA